MQKDHDRLLSAGGQYGFILAVAFAAAGILAPRHGLQVFWTLMAIHLAIGGIVLWRRTGLQLGATSEFLGAAYLVLLGQLYGLGGPPFSWPARWWLLTVVVVAVGGLCMYLERYVHPDHWAAWDRYMEDKSGWDILLMRHIPDLRGSDRSRVS